MGQYYKPIIIDKESNIVASLKSWDFESGAKLMEHSWMLNDFVQTFEQLISSEGNYHKSRVVWAGDYADDEDKLIYSEYHKKEVPTNLHTLVDDEHVLKNLQIADTSKFRYLVNHTKKEFVDKSKVIDINGWRIHPLPLLTCEGNGRGGGDYHYNTFKRNLKSGKVVEVDLPSEVKTVGRWARDVISAETEKPKGYKEFKFKLYEKW